MTTVLALVGCLLIIGGVTLLSVPFGLIAAGLAAFGGAVAYEAGE